MEAELEEILARVKMFGRIAGDYKARYEGARAWSADYEALNGKAEDLIAALVAWGQALAEALQFVLEVCDDE